MLSLCVYKELARAEAGWGLIAFDVLGLLAAADTILLNPICRDFYLSDLIRDMYWDFSSVTSKNLSESGSDSSA